ncbi:MAG: hypothetical protein LBI02_11830 [Opitutaceae bacterium]|nr:hypothetical protein [Opitutaceae bacterium]
MDAIESVRSKTTCPPTASHAFPNSPAPPQKSPARAGIVQARKRRNPPTHHLGRNADCSADFQVCFIPRKRRVLDKFASERSEKPDNPRYDSSA